MSDTHHLGGYFGANIFGVGYGVRMTHSHTSSIISHTHLGRDSCTAAVTTRVSVAHNTVITLLPLFLRQQLALHQYTTSRPIEHFSSSIVSVYQDPFARKVIFW